MVALKSSNQVHATINREYIILVQDGDYKFLTTARKLEELIGVVAAHRMFAKAMVWPERVFTRKMRGGYKIKFSSR